MHFKGHGRGECFELYCSPRKQQNHFKVFFDEAYMGFIGEEDEQTMFLNLFSNTEGGRSTTAVFWEDIDLILNELWKLGAPITMLNKEGKPSSRKPEVSKSLKHLKRSNRHKNRLSKCRENAISS